MKFLGVGILLISACGAVTTVPKAKPTGYLMLEVKPETADVLVDDEYVGTVEAFDGGLPVPAGTRRIMFRKRGYETERFDISIQSGEEVTLRLQLIASIDLEEEEDAPRRSILREAKKHR